LKDKQFFNNFFKMLRYIQAVVYSHDGRSTKIRFFKISLPVEFINFHFYRTCHFKVHKATFSLNLPFQIIALSPVSSYPSMSEP
jgi:hypothetical protein